MAYAPNNLPIFTAAFAGALAGMGASDRILTDPIPNNNVNQIAGAFAQAIDTAWGSTPATELDIQSMEEICEGSWQDRTPQPITPFLNPSTFNNLALAIIALVQSGELYFASQGIISPEVPSSSYLSITEWFVDSINGSDNNDGKTALTALKTEAQLEKRIPDGSQLNGTINSIDPLSTIFAVHYLNDLPPDDPIGFQNWKLPGDTASQFGLLALLGESTDPTKIKHNGIITGFTDYNGNLNQFATLTDALVADFTPYVNLRIRITTPGPTFGLYAYIKKDIGGGMVITSPFSMTNDVSAPLPLALNFYLNIPGTPNIGDAYVIEDLTILYFKSPTTTDAQSNGTFGVSDARIKPFANGWTSLLSSAFSNYSGCIFDGIVVKNQDGYNPFMFNCCFTGEIQSYTNICNIDGGTYDFINIRPRGAITLSGGCLCVGGNGVLVQGLLRIADSAGFLDVPTAAITTTGKSLLLVIPFSPGAPALVWGNVPDIGIYNGPGTQTLWDSINIPDNVNPIGIQGNGGPGTSDVRLGDYAQPNARAFDESTGLYTAGDIALAPLCSFANLSGAAFSSGGSSPNAAHQLSTNSHFLGI